MFSIFWPTIQLLKGIHTHRGFWTVENKKRERKQREEGEKAEENKKRERRQRLKVRKCYVYYVQFTMLNTWNCLYIDSMCSTSKLGLKPSKPTISL